MSSSAPESPAPGCPAGPSLFPYYLILFGSSAGLACIIVLLADLRDQLGFSEIGIGLAIGSGFGAAFVANLVMAPHADRGRAPAMLRAGLALAVAGLEVLLQGDLRHVDEFSERRVGLRLV